MALNLLIDYDEESIMVGYHCPHCDEIIYKEDYPKLECKLTETGDLLSITEVKCPICENGMLEG